MINTVTKYVTDDGKEFHNLIPAQLHDMSLKKAAEKAKNLTEERFNALLKLWKESPNLHGVIETHALNSIGAWAIFGEGRSFDRGVSYYRPLIGIVYGRLEAAMRHAVNLERFYTAGDGGTIEPTTIQNVD